MQVKLNIGSDSNGSEMHELLIDGEHAEFIADLSECPEDAHIGRDLIDGNDIIQYMQMAYEAGKSGESFEVVYGKIK